MELMDTTAIKNGLDPGLDRGFWRRPMHGIIYLVGLIVVILAILSFFGLR
jgi:hypothetical protein